MEKKIIQPHVLSVGYQNKNHHPLYRFFSSQRFLALIGLVFLLLIVLPLAKVHTQKRLVEREIADVQAQIAEYEQKNQELEQMITYLQSDQSLEEQARVNLNLKKPGESVVVIERAASATAVSVENKNAIPESNLAKWRHYFFD